MVMAEYTGMTPTVVVGLGGTGKEILIKIRRMIVESYGTLDALPIVSFLHLDTEQNAKVSEPQTVLKQDISLRPVEQVWTKVEDAKAILSRIGSYPYLAEWFPSQLKGTDSILAGAGQIRALGRFAFAVNYQQVKGAFAAARGRLRGHEKFMLDTWKVQLDQGINIFVVGSLSGGTGSGMLLDLAYNLRDWVPPSDLPQSSAYLVLPGAFSGLGDRVIANAYAALMELDYYSRTDTRFEVQYSTAASDRISDQSGRDVPFNFCYLVGNSNNKVTFASLEAVLEMVSQNIFLDFSSGFSQFKKLVRDNIRKHWAGPDPLGYPQSFITFGLSSIQFPIERVINACASRLAGRVVRWWMNPTPSPTAMRDLIRTEILPGLVLAESDNQHQLLDSIAMGDNAKPYTKEVADWAASLRKRRNDLQIPFENLQRFVLVEQEKYAVHFSDGDTDPRRWSDFYQKMFDNLERLSVQKCTELRTTLARMIEDRFRGPKFARQFLEVLLEVLADYKSRFDQDRQKTWIPQERSSANALQTLTKQVDDQARQFLLLDRKRRIDETFNAIMLALETVYVSKIEVKSRTLGVQLVEALREESERLLSDLTRFDRLMESLEAQFADKENTYLRETRTLTVNGILLYDEKDVGMIYQNTLGEREQAVCGLISEKVLSASDVSLFELHTFDTFRARDLFGRLLDASLDEFVGRSRARVSAARKFLETYPTVEQQEAQIKTTFEKSEPFLRFSQEQARLGWDDKPEKRQTLVGIQGGNKPDDPAAATILPFIRKTSTITDKDIRPLGESHRIFFVQEAGAFPLRLIEGMARMRSVYRAVKAVERNPLHTDSDEDRFGDLMPSTEDEVQVRRNAILGRALGLIDLVENKLTGYQEARLRFFDRQSGLEKTEVLGSDWQSATEFLLGDTNRRFKDILADELARQGGAPTTRPAKQEFYTRLMQWLAVHRAEVEGGEDNPAYREAAEAVEDFIKTHNLYIEGTARPGTAANGPARAIPAPIPEVLQPGDPARESNLDKYRKLVESCVKDGELSTTEKMLLERFRVRYGVSPEQSQQLIDLLTPKPQNKEAVLEYGLMFRAFLENDAAIDPEEQAQLLELQEELGLTNDQVYIIEANVKEELGHS
ncbi:tubulin-like doman-containing protein [Gloeobacter morelensis MG652769]|uniref:Tubulin-like doman-containing protein n=2 Tax=Gloeobacter TaxID=33071 RepID=A0ABY3PQ00_9CYAN|nr:tubulin-like doman-containing protein [Gloeobacter morelensis MG652769]